MMYSKRHLPGIEQWGQISGSNVIPRRAHPGLAGIGPHSGGVDSTGAVNFAGGGASAGAR